MKNSSNIKTVILLLSFASTTALLLPSCSTNDKPEDPKETAEKQNEVKFDTNKQQKDAQFLVDAAEMNMEEIRLGQLAQQKGTSAHVKELGKMMEDAHTKSLRDLTVLAKSKNITIPSSPTDDAHDSYRKLNDKTGNDFDKAYTDLMVDKHEDAIDTFEKAASNSNDIDIRNWATTSLAQLRTHLNHSVEYQKKSENK
jgi:putative membrane protein